MAIPAATWLFSSAHTDTLYTHDDDVDPRDEDEPSTVVLSVAVARHRYRDLESL